MRSDDDQAAGLPGSWSPDGESTVPSSVGLLRGWADRGECFGAQLFVWVDDAVVADLAVGRAGHLRAASITDVGRLYCAVKPLAALCLTLAVESGQASFDDPASKFLPEFTGDGREAITLRQLLSHTSGLFDYRLDIYKRGFRDIVRIASKYPLKEHSWYRQARYNDVIAWCILGAVIERIYSAGLANVVSSLACSIPGKPNLRMDFPDPSTYVQCHMLRDGSYYPVPEPQPEVMFRTVNPAHGGFGSAHDLGLLYAELIRSALGRGNLLGQGYASQLIGQQSVVSYGLGDARRACALGFIRNVSEDGIGGQWSQRSFGHAGYVGQYKVVHAFGDLDHRLAVAIRFFSVGSKNNWRIHALGKALYSDLKFNRASTLLR